MRDNGAFVPVSYATGLDFDTDGRANASFDYDGDGDLDLVSLSRQKLRLLENRSPGKNHFIRFSLVEPNGQASLGAQIQIRSKQLGKQKDYVKLSSGYATAVLPAVHFGLKNDKAVEEVQVVWPDKTKQRFEALAGERHWKIIKGEKPVEMEIIRWAARVEDRAQAKEFSIPQKLKDLKNQPSIVPSLSGPRVVTFWASWCEGCKKEHPELVRFSQSKQAQVIGISVDQDIAAAGKFSNLHPSPYPNFLANDEVVQNYFGDSGEIQLPATFVFSGAGDLRRAFFYPVTEKELTAAVSSAEEVKLTKGDGFSLRQEAMSHLNSGRRKEALRLYEMSVKIDPNTAIGYMSVGLLLKDDGRIKEARGHFEKAMKIAPNYAAPYVALGDLARNRRDYKKAAMFYEQALEKKPGFYPALKGKERLPNQDSNVRKILKELEKVR